ncbi:MAG: DUF1579 domain-containing protein [Acidobacteriota bacterium]
MKARGLAMLCLFSLVGVVAPVLAQQDKNAAPPAMDMDAMMKAAQPGEQHKHLARMAGDWEYTSKMWMAPGQAPEESKGTMHGETLMGGRYVQHHWKGNMAGMSFEGMGTEAYDNTTKQFVSSWIDNMGTGIMFSKGSCDAAGKVCTMTGDMPDPMGGGNVTTKMVLTWADNDHFKNEMFMKDPSGGEMKMMEISAWRKK